MAAKPKQKPTSTSPATLVSGADIAAIDRLIHERNRLAIVSALASQQQLAFNELKDILGISDGNLSTHCRKLEEAGYLACEKRFEGRMPRTEYHLTALGKQALQQYLGHMEALIAAMKPA